MCRFLALIRDGVTLSKYDGGKWALENMNSNYNEIIKKAMDDYISDTDNAYDDSTLNDFAQETISMINDCLNSKIVSNSK